MLISHRNGREQQHRYPQGRYQDGRYQDGRYQDGIAATSLLAESDRRLVEGIRSVIEDAGAEPQEMVLGSYGDAGESCLVIDVEALGLTGSELIQKLQEGGYPLPTVMVTASASSTTPALPGAGSVHLTRRQRQILDLVLAGQRSKNIAADLGISQRTVENHRALIMKKTGSKSIPELARLMFSGHMEKASG